jgi:PAS domain S-box-containing protein
MINFSFTLLYTSESLPAEADKLSSGYDHSVSIPIGDFNPETIKDKLPGIFILESGLSNRDVVKKIIKAVSSEHSVIILLKHDDLPENAIKNFPGDNQYIVDYPLKGKELELTLEFAKLSYDKSQLVKKSELLSEAVNQSANSIIITNPKGEVEFVNHNFEEKTGYTQEEVVGKNIRLIKASEQDKETYRLMWETVTKGEKWKGEFCNRKKNGELFWDESTITPILDSQGNIIHYLAINNDVTARKNAEAELEQGRQLLKQIIDRVPQYIFVRDSQGRYHLANKSFAEYCGKKPEEIVGQKEIDINPNVDYAREILEEDAFVIESGTNILREEKFFDQKLGRERYFQYSKVPFTLPDTGEDSVLSVWTDVTEQKETEQELREAREKLLDAQKLASFGNWSYDIENKVAKWSEQVYEQYGLPSDKPAPFGDEFYTHVHPDDKQLIMDTMEKAREGGFAKYECRAIKPDKTITHIEATVKPLYRDGVLTGFFGTSLDITTRKKFEDELVLARKEAIAASKAKSDFLSVMSHEIRTPLNAIIVMAEMLINEVEDPTHKENLEILNYSAKDLLRIVNDILDYSKIEAGKLDLESIDVNIRDFASKIIKTNQLKADEKGIRLELDFDESIPETIKGDPLRLGQILRNLISNSIKFTEKGGVKLSVKLRGIDKESCRLYFGVKDTGIGIRHEKVDSLFEVFTQASSETSRKFGGTGLGLAIVKNLLVIHNSQIYVESEPEKGSLFYFEIDFPYTKTIETKPEVLEEGSLIKSLKGYNIMLVEDNVMNIMVAKKIFKKWDCNINVAEDGYIALQKATRIDFDLIVMDLQMPGIDGFETTRKLRKLSEHYSKIPIIALTAAAPSEVKEKVLEAGMNEMVTKPFKTNLLYETIKAHLPEKSQNLVKSENIIRSADADLDYNKVSIEVLVKLRTFLHRPNQNEAIKYIENVARSRAANELESEGLVEIIETINSIIRINKSYINNKNLLVKEMISDLKKAIDDLKLKYE